jgi:hypothetical protein
VERSTDGAVFTLVITLGANVTSYQTRTSTASTQYWYRVKATDTANDSAPSNRGHGHHLPPPAPPSNLTADASRPARST